MTYAVRHLFNNILVKAYEASTFNEVMEADKAAVAMLDAAAQDANSPVELSGVGSREVYSLRLGATPFYYLIKR